MDDRNARCISSYLETHIHDRLSKLTGYQGYFSWFHTLRVIHILIQEKPDIIHLHNLHGNYLCLPVLFRYLSKLNCKIVVSLHDCWLFTGKCPHFTDVQCYRWKESCGHCPQLDIYPKSTFFDRTAKCLTDKKRWFDRIGTQLTVVAVSEWLKGEAKESFLNKAPIYRIYNGISTDVFDIRPYEDFIDKKYNIQNEYIILGVASIWDPRKGINDFLKLSEMIDIDERIVLVGLSPKQCENLPVNVIGIPHTENQQELVALYNRADVFFNASTEETFGMVTAEALACGTPVIVYNSTACAEMVRKDTGTVVSPHDITGVNEAIKCMRKDNFKNLNRLNCRKSILKSFSKEGMAEKYNELYKNILEDRL